MSPDLPISGEAVDAVIQSLIGEDRLAEDYPKRRALPGGFTDTLVFRLWFEKRDPLVVKMGPSSSILAEHGKFHRFSVAQDLDESLRHVGAEENVRLPDGTIEPWRAMAMPYAGPQTFSEWENSGNFEDIVRAFTGPVESSSPGPQPPSFGTLDQSLQQIAGFLVSMEPDRERIKRPGYLCDYVQEPDWKNEKLRACLRLLESRVGDLEKWWQISKDLPMASPDWRFRHGDPRLANILGNSTRPEVSWIDFGNAGDGHVFRDFVRFEVDLWLRAAPRAKDDSNVHPPDPQAVLDMLNAMFQAGAYPPSSDYSRYAHVVFEWRRAMYREFPAIQERGGIAQYGWFLLAEVLKRITWVKAGSVEESGAGMPLLLECAALVLDKTDGVGVTHRQFPGGTTNPMALEKFPASTPSPMEATIDAPDSFSEVMMHGADDNSESSRPVGFSTGWGQLETSQGLWRFTGGENGIVATAIAGEVEDLSLTERGRGSLVMSADGRAVACLLDGHCEVGWVDRLRGGIERRWVSAILADEMVKAHPLALAVGMRKVFLMMSDERETFQVSLVPVSDTMRVSQRHQVCEGPSALGIYLDGIPHTVAPDGTVRSGTLRSMIRADRVISLDVATGGGDVLVAAIGEDREGAVRLELAGGKRGSRVYSSDGRASVAVLRQRAASPTKVLVTRGRSLIRYDL